MSLENWRFYFKVYFITLGCLGARSVFDDIPILTYFEDYRISSMDRNAFLLRQMILRFFAFPIYFPLSYFVSMNDE